MTCVSHIYDAFKAKKVMYHIVRISILKTNKDPKKIGQKNVTDKFWTAPFTICIAPSIC